MISLVRCESGKWWKKTTYLHYFLCPQSLKVLVIYFKLLTWPIRRTPGCQTIQRIRVANPLFLLQRRIIPYPRIHSLLSSLSYNLLQLHRKPLQHRTWPSFSTLHLIQSLQPHRLTTGPCTT